MTVVLTVYMLVWPVIVFGVLVKIASAFFGEIRQAHKEGRPVI